MKAYEILAEQILQKIKEGVIPWRRPWNWGNPVNFVSGKEYRGFNRLVLSLSWHGDHRFLTHKQVTGLGWILRKGAKGIKIFFFKFEEREDRKDSYPILRYYVVFNISDTTGIDVPPIEECKMVTPLAKAQAIMSGYQGKPRMLEWNRACYSVSRDTITLPSLYKFKTNSAYFSTLFHEYIHSTGHKTRLWRLNLDMIEYSGRENYSREELVAEIGSMFLCQEANISQETEADSHAYLAWWLKYLSDHKKELIYAAWEAQKASDYILWNIVPSEV